MTYFGFDYDCFIILRRNLTVNGTTYKEGTWFRWDFDGKMARVKIDGAMGFLISEEDFKEAFCQDFSKYPPLNNLYV